MLNVNNNEKRETQSGKGIKGKGKKESTQANTINEYSYYIEDVITIWVNNIYILLYYIYILYRENTHVKKTE